MFIINKSLAAGNPVSIDKQSFGVNNNKTLALECFMPKADLMYNLKS